MPIVGEPLKQCMACSRHLKLSCFSPDKRTADGLRNRCNDCLYGKHKSHVDASQIQTKRCCDCGQYRPVEKFYKAKGRPDGRQSVCKECLKKPGYDRKTRYKAGENYVAVTEKQCRKCKQTKPSSEFYVNFQSRDHLGTRCKECCRKDYDANDNKRLAAKLRKFGLTVAQYTSMFEAQAGLCALCHKPETRTYFGKLMLLCLDHNHVTGKARQLLCARCNYAIGGLEYLRRNGLLDDASQYINRHES